LIGRDQVSSLIRGPQDLLTMLGAGANAVEDADRRDEASEVRIRSPFDSQHVAEADSTSADSIGRRSATSASTSIT
jgi:hypothetical protein